MPIRTRAIHFFELGGWDDNFDLNSSDGSESDDEIFSEPITEGNEDAEETYLIFAKLGRKYLSITCTNNVLYRVSYNYRLNTEVFCYLYIDVISEARMNSKLQTEVLRYGNIYRSQTPELAAKLIKLAYAAADWMFDQTGTTFGKGNPVAIMDKTLIGKFMIDRYNIKHIRVYITQQASLAISATKNREFSIEPVAGREVVSPQQTLLFKN